MCGTGLLTAVNAMQARVANEVMLPPGYAIGWSGQFEYLEQAAAKLKTVIPLTLGVIFILLYFAFRSTSEALLLMATVPFVLIGGFWFVWLLGRAVSVATVVGFIALAGLAAEFGVVMLVYLRNALNDRLAAGQPLSKALILDAIRAGAGAEVMERTAAPMVGGMITAPLLSLFVIPAGWRMLQEWTLRASTRRH